MVAYAEKISHASVVQLRNRRDVEFRPPTLDQVVETLQGGRPMNARDLQALVADHIRGLAKELQHGPTDPFRIFWNVDSRGRPRDPRPEDVCRDHLLDYLSLVLARAGVALEPEGHYARNKRSDIKAIIPPLNLPVEIKRHYHRDLWNAPEQQLQKLYTRDPGTEGYGIYLVLWFDEVQGRRMPLPPQGIARPATADELEDALQCIIQDETRTTIDVIVVDVSGS